MTTVTGTTVPTLAALQQVYRKIPAPGAKIKQAGKALDLTLPVQIERRTSLLVLNYSRKSTQSPALASG